MTLKLALVQDNPVVGALADNRSRLLARVAEAAAAGADLVVFPELATIGYPPKDLLDLAGFVAANEETVAALAQATAELGVGVIVGHVARNPAPVGKRLLNAASLLDGGRVVQRWAKALLPTYDVFDEERYFEPGPGPAAVASFRGVRLGITICEDIWTEPQGRQLYRRSPGHEQLAAGADLLVNVSASPYEMDKLAERRALVSALAREGGVPMVYCNQVGANDELVFDGGSFACDGAGRLVAQAPQFVEHVLWVELDAGETLPELEPPEEGTAAVLAALELGLRDYVHKCGFANVVLGLSGGIDSAVVCAIAARALGPDHVVGLLMPSPWSSDHSIADSDELARNLGIEHHIVPIEAMMQAYDMALAPLFEGRGSDVTEENVQARIRGNLLMAYSNKHGHLLLTTGNKSELAVGYCTLYGDMAGGLAVISDVPKMMVYALGRLCNAPREVIPEHIFVKPPSAELRPGQKDEDSLPPYPELDAIIDAWVTEHASEEEIVDRGHDPATVSRIIGLLHRTEFKRRQAAPGLKVTSKAFGFGRRFPVAHRRR